MSSNNCLNCGKILTDKFCSGCGQKADTHRITFKNFIFHDLLHGTFHIERGILFTAKQALTRPGKAALDYISGKRKQYYNVFYFILLTFGVMLFIRHFYDGLIMEHGEKLVDDAPKIDEASKRVNNMIYQNSKYILLLFVPLGAINSFLLFKRKKLNLTEHAIISGVILLGCLLISTFGHILFFLNLVFKDFVAVIVNVLTPTIIFFYIGFTYYNAFSENYTRLGILYRIVLFYVLLCLELIIFTFILIGIATDWKMGTVVISPFG